MASYARISGLLWADWIAYYVIWVLMIYLTDVWKLDFTHAAAIINVFCGLKLILPLFMSFIVDSFLGDYCMLLLSSLSYCLGLGFLAMSTPPVLARSTGNCSLYEPVCIGSTQKILFYAALPLISIGLAGHGTSLGSFLATQVLHNMVEFVEGDQDINWKSIFCQGCGWFGVIYIAMIGAFVLTFVNPWSVRFGVPAICMVVATCLFLTGSFKYIKAKPEGSSLTTIFRVIVASTSKLFYRTPRNADRLYEVPGLEIPDYIAHTSGLRCLDKAAIKLPNTTVEGQEKNRWRLCRVTEIEATKTMIRMIPMAMTLFVVGIVSSTGSTYFLEQANNMNPKVGRLKVPLPIFLIFMDAAENNAANIYGKIVAKMASFGCGKYAPTVGFLMAMTASILCCITAAKVEERRLGVAMRHNLLDNNGPHERVPISMFWLLPQYLFLGAFQQIFLSSLATFFAYQVPATFQSLMMQFASAVYGMGYMDSVLSVYLVGKVSGSGTRASWFQKTLNKSRMDNYYWTLTVMSVVNMVLCISVSLWYTCQESRTNDEEPEAEESETDEDGLCCCG